jgi:hypothetical protein
MLALFGEAVSSMTQYGFRLQLHGPSVAPEPPTPASSPRDGCGALRGAIRQVFGHRFTPTCARHPKADRAHTGIPNDVAHPVPPAPEFARGTMSTCGPNRQPVARYSMAAVAGILDIQCSNQHSRSLKICECAKPMTGIRLNSVGERPHNNRVLVTDITDKNAHVSCELSVRHPLGKGEIAGPDDASFLSDLRGIRCRPRSTGLEKVPAFGAPVQGQPND